MIRLSCVTQQSASELVCNYLICNSCGVIDKDFGRLRRGHRCTICGIESEAGRLVFPISVHVIADLAHDAYHSTSPVGVIEGPQGRDVGTVLYFCTLREVLLNSFLTNHLRAKRLSEPLLKRLFADNRLASQRFGPLFVAAIETTWEEAVSAVSERDGQDYKTVSDFMKTAAEQRNDFLHQGLAWAIDRQLATSCIDSMEEMVALFVGLHNEFTHPLLKPDA